MSIFVRERYPSGLLTPQLGLFLVVIATWFFYRREVTPSLESSIIEALLFVSLILGQLFLRKFASRLGVMSSILVLVLLFLGISSEVKLSSEWYINTDLAKYPQYWRGFGPIVAIVGLVISVLLALVRQSPAVPFVRTLKSLISDPGSLLSKGAIPLAVLLTPAILQTSTSWLNLGDGTNKVLDEFSGYLAGNYPGIDTIWSHSSLLGLPLIVVRWLPLESAALKIYSVVVWVNVLTVLTAFLVGKVARLAFPRLPSAVGYLVGVLSLSVSGVGNGNTALFQELNYLSRLVLPLALGLATVKFVGQVSGVNRMKIGVLAVLGIATAANNLEFGVPAFLASASVVTVGMRNFQERKSLRSTYLVGSLVSITVLLVQSWLSSESWFKIRCGVFCSAFDDIAATGIHNNTGPIPFFGITTILLSLSGVLVAHVLGNVLDRTAQRFESQADLATAYFGLWVLILSPYIFYGTGGGAFRSQVQIPLMCIQGLLFSRLVLVSSLEGPAPVSLSSDFAVFQRRTILAMPALFLIGVIPALIFQVPNPVKELKRITDSASYVRNLDEWSPSTIDWIVPTEVLSMTSNYGGPKNVGWWFENGNAIQLLTGIDNDSGVNGFEYIRDRGYNLQGACEALLSGERVYYLTRKQEIGPMSTCRGLKIQLQARFEIWDFVMVRVMRNSD